MRPERKRGSLCRKESCKKRSRQCNEFTELDCEIIFQEYWKSADIRKQETYIQSLVDLKAKATSTLSEQSRRQHTKCYRLKKHGEVVKRVQNYVSKYLGGERTQDRCCLEIRFAWSWNKQSNCETSKSTPEPRICVVA